ncbi:DNA primase [Candidatus Margulisiibacteriota bacterium]
MSGIQDNMILNSSIDEIRSKTDIVKVISEYVSLKKRGKNYLGLCPFHSEKTPSFTVSPEKGICHCFGCGEGGNVFAFLMKIENISFAESVEMLGEKLGIAVKKNIDTGKTALKDKYMEIMDLALKFYKKKLDEEGQAALDYLKKRGISKETADRFMLGYAPARWEALYEFLFKKGVSQKDMLTVGLTMERKDGTGYYDRFRNRLLFPIFNMRSKAIGFSGRTLSSEEGAKYINSPDSPIYNKGYTLYGINLAKDAIKKEEFAIMVEGNVDLLTCHQSGIRNAVAPLGTAFTSHQAKMLNRFTKNVIIVFDKDSAGSAATARSAHILRENDISVFIASLSGGKDPDEAIRKSGTEAFIEDLKNAKPWMEYYIEMILQKHNMKLVEEKTKAVKELAKVLAAEKDPLTQEEYIKLISKKTHMDPATIESEVKRQGFYLSKPSSGSSTSKRTVEKPSSKMLKAEETLIRLAMDDTSLLEKFKELINWKEFILPSHRLVAEMLQTIDMGSSKEALSHSIIENLPGDEEKKLLTRILVQEIPSGNREKMLEDCANTIKAHHLRSKLEGLRVEIGNAEKINDFEKVTELHKQFNEFSRLYRELGKAI